MSKFSNAMFGLIWLAPILLAVLGRVVSTRLSSRRWIVHSLVFAAMLFALPALIYFRGLIDPTTIEGPGPGDGGIVLLYLAMLVLSALIYGVIAWTSYRARKRDDFSSLPAN
jgi:hypothetical protein